MHSALVSALHFGGRIPPWYERSPLSGTLLSALRLGGLVSALRFSESGVRFGVLSNKAALVVSLKRTPLW